MFSFLTPHKTLIEALAVAALIAGIAFGIHTFLAHEQEIGYQRAVGEYTAKQLLAEQAARAKEQALTKQLEDAKNAAVEREKLLSTLGAAVGTSSAGLRDTAAALRNGLPVATLDAVRKTADAALAVFADCQGRYGAMAAIADRHASDVKTLTDAWPK